MSSGIAQLLSVGAQDTHLTGDPQVSFFRSNYRRYTNFSQVIHEQVIQGNIRNNQMSSIRLDREGDLLSYMYLTAENDSGAVSIEEWRLYIDKVELLIGGSVIDTQDSEFNQEISIDLLAQTFSKSAASSLHGGFGTESDFYPLRFFMCENWQNALPICALEYHDVELRIYWGPQVENYRWKLFANYIYVDGFEREFFKENEHDMLVYQVQKNIPSNDKVQELNFVGPVKFITSSNAITGEVNSLASVSNKIKIEINGIDLSEMKLCSPHYTSVSSYYSTSYATGNRQNQFVYPFCLDTSKLQPTGTLNFSRLTTARIVSEQFVTRNIFAVGYNILRIKNGLAGLLYMG